MIELPSIATNAIQLPVDFGELKPGGYDFLRQLIIYWKWQIRQPRPRVLSWIVRIHAPLKRLVALLNNSATEDQKMATHASY